MEIFNFRGLSGKPDEEKYVYGYLKKDQEGSTAYYDTHSYRIIWYEDGAYHGFPVRNGTIDRSTGLKDKNGNLMFENDIIKVDKLGVFRIIADSFYIYVLVGADLDHESWENFCLNTNSTYEDKCTIMLDAEIIGNFRQNPELLEA